MEFKPFYFEDEVRDGFYIPGMVKRSWAASMDVLEHVKEICSRHNIKWFAFCGTLLGAVRHHGFIPWDDDLDIGIFRADYEKLISILEKELPKEYVVINSYTDKSQANFITRITNSNGINTSPEYLNSHFGFPYVAGIDVFPVDYLYDDLTKYENHYRKTKALWTKTDETKDASLVSEVEKCFMECQNEKSEYVTLMPIWMKNKGYRIPSGCFDDIVEIPFENTVINVPAGYTTVLNYMYTNWYTISLFGGEHDYPFYKNQEETFKSKMNFALYRYFFDEKEMEKMLEKYNQSISDEAKTDNTKECIFDEKLDEFVQLLNRIVRKADLIISNPYNKEMLLDEKVLPGINEMLVGAQNIAISIGNTLEQYLGEGTLMVSCLEAFCEKAYKLHEKLNSGCNNETTLGLMETFDEFKSAYECEILRKKNILFVLTGYSDFIEIEKYIIKASLEPNTNVFLMPVPYMERGHDGTVIKEYYDGTAIKDYFDEIAVDENYDGKKSELNNINVHFLNYLNHNIEQMHFDTAFIQKSQDSYGSGFTIHPAYYTNNIREITETLIYISPLNINEFDYQDLKSLENMNYYLQTPGALSADIVYLNSKKTRQNAISYFVSITDTKYQSFFEDKFRVLSESDLALSDAAKPLGTAGNAKSLGAAKTVRDAGIADNADAAKTLGTKDMPKDSDIANRKKKLVVYISFSDAYIYREKILLKLEAIVSILQQYAKDFEIIWLEDNAIRKNEDLFEESFLLSFEKLKERILSFSASVNSEDFDKIVPDAFYGSAGYELSYCMLQRIPVLKMCL